MPISLHECTVASFDTTLGALEQVLAKGRAYCEESDIALDDVVGEMNRVIDKGGEDGELLVNLENELKELKALKRRLNATLS